MVASDKMSKTRRVVVERLVPHPKYGKMMRRRTICHAHDEENASHKGDLVEIMETRPLSKLKRWRIVRIVRAGAQQALAGEDEAAPASDRAERADRVDRVRSPRGDAADAGRRPRADEHGCQALADSASDRPAARVAVP